MPAIQEEYIMRSTARLHATNGCAKGILLWSASATLALTACADSLLACGSLEQRDKADPASSAQDEFPKGSYRVTRERTADGKRLKTCFEVTFARDYTFVVKLLDEAGSPSAAGAVKAEG